MEIKNSAGSRLSCLLFLTACVFFLLYRWSVLLTIYEARELPIEPDDSFIYILNIKLAFSTDLFNDQTFKSTSEFSKLVLFNQGSEYARNVLSWIDGPKYFAYSHLMRIFAYITDVKLTDLLIASGFLIQPLILISFTTFCRFYIFLPYKTIAVATLLFSFTSIENIHVLMATPFSFSVIFVLFAAALQKNDKFFLAAIFYFTAMLFHPGALLGIFLILLNDGLNKILQFQKGKPHLFLTNFFNIKLTLPIFVVLIGYSLNYLIFLLSNGSITLVMNSSPFSEQVFNIKDLVIMNILKSVKYIYIFLSKFTHPILITPFVIWSFFKGPYVKNSRFLLLSWSLGVVLTWAHMMPTHPGALTTYNLQYFAVVFSIYVSQMFIHYFNELRKNLDFQK